MTIQEQLMHGSNLAFCEQYYGLDVVKLRESFLHKTFIGDCWRGREDLADRPSTCRWALPCATEAEQHEPLQEVA